MNLNKRLESEYFTIERSEFYMYGPAVQFNTTTLYVAL